MRSGSAIGNHNSTLLHRLLSAACVTALAAGFLSAMSAPAQATALAQGAPGVTALSGKLPSGSSSTRSTLTLSVNGQAAPAAGVDTGTPVTATARVLNASGAPMANVAVWFTVSGSARLSTDYCYTGTDGQCSVTFTDTVNEAVNVCLYVFVNGSYEAASNSPQSITFRNKVWPDATKSSISIYPQSVAAGASIVATVTVKDASGAPMQGVVVSFSKKSTVVTLSAPTCTTAANGQCSISVSSVSAGVFTNEVSAKVDVRGVATDVMYSPVTVTFTGSNVYCPPNVCRSSIAIDTTDAVTVGTNHVITVTLRDDYERLVTTEPATSVTLVLPAGLTLASPVTQNPDGTYSASVTAKVPGSYPVSAKWNGQPIGPNAPDVVYANYKAGAPAIDGFDCAPGAKSTNLSVDPATLMIGETSMGTALITDKYCNPLPNVPVTFTVTGSATLTPRPSTITTDANGLAKVAVTDNTVESVTLTATIAAGQVPSARTITFTGSVCPVCVTKSTISIDSNDYVPVGTNHVVTVKLNDYYGRIITTEPTTSITLVLPTGLTQVSPVIQNADGSYSAAVSSKIVGSYPVSAKWNGEPIGANAPDVVYANYKAGAPAIDGFDCAPGAKSTNLSANPVSLYVGETSTGTALITDKYCNPVPNVDVTFTVTGSATASVTAPGSFTTNAHGVATVGVTDNTAESVTLTATIAVGQVPTPQTITFSARGPMIKPTIDTPKPGKTIVTNKPHISGTAAYPGTITVTDNGTPIPGCINIPVVAGAWSCDPTQPMPDGSHTLVAIETDQNRNTITSDPVTFTINTTKPVITKPIPGTTVVTAKPKIEGTAPGDDGSTVKVTDENNNVVCTAVLQAGKWSCIPDQPLTPGPHTLTPTVTDTSGNSLRGDPVAINVNATPPVITAPPNNSITKNASPTISGTANVARDVITVTAGNPAFVVCTAIVNNDLTWSCVPSRPLADGQYTITATETDASGNISAPSNAVTFKVKTTAPAPPKVNPSNGSKVSGEAEDGTTIDVYGPNGPISGCTNVPVVNGKWSCIPTTPIKPGTVINVTAKDDAGNVSQPTCVTIQALGIKIKYPQVQDADTEVVTGYNFNPGESVTCMIHSDRIVVGTGIAQADGTVQFSFKIDVTKVPIGMHTATLIGAQSGSVSGTFEVIPCNNPGKVQTGGSMYTVLPVGLLAAALVVAGWAGLVVARRRQQTA